MKYKLGIMSSTWELEADNADLAVVASMLFTQSSAPIVIYEPSEEKSRFSAGLFGGISREVDEFILENLDSLKIVIKTIKYND